MLEIQAGVPTNVGIEVAFRIDFKVLVAEAKVGAAHILAALARRRLHEERRIEQQTLGVSAVAHDP